MYKEKERTVADILHGEQRVNKAPKLEGSRYPEGPRNTEQFSLIRREIYLHRKSEIRLGKQMRDQWTRILDTKL